MKIGNRFLIKNTNDEYILCLVDCPKSLVNLIKLSGGNPWSSPVVVENPYDITESEMKKIMKESFGKFIKVEREKL